MPEVTATPTELPPHWLFLLFATYYAIAADFQPADTPLSD
jgi:hypothetical protein